MRRLAVLILAGSLLVQLAGCGQDLSPLRSTSPQATVIPVESEPTPSPSPKPEQVAYTDILAGDCDGQTVYIDCALTGIDHSYDFDYMRFHMWADDGEKYVYAGFGQPPHLHSATEPLAEAQNGDIYRFCVQISDSMIDLHYLKSAEKLDGSADVALLEQSFKDECDPVTCEDILRNPEKYYDTQVGFFGTVMQVVEQDDDRTTFLLSTNGELSGLVYATYDRGDEAARLLEGDHLLVYGYVGQLYSYISVRGDERTVPQLRVILVDIVPDELLEQLKDAA